MDTLQRATNALRKAEATLRDVVAEAAANGDYANVVRIASWGHAIREMLNADDQKKKESAAPVLKSVTIANGVSNTAPKRPTAGATRQDKYPRFFRRGDFLVRIAWSKRKKAEYQHKASYRVLHNLAAAIAHVGRDGRIFSTDDFLPIHDADGSEVPSYQAYVGLALLKQSKLIDQHGRQGYSIATVTEFNEAVESAWRKLPDK